MKVTTTLLAVMAFAVSQAAAVPSPDADAEARLRVGFCGAPGTPCLVGRDAEAQPEAEAKKHHKHHHKHHHLRLGFCGAPGTPCLVGRDENDPQGDEAGYCGAPGNPCNTVKRAAHSIADALAEARAVDSEGTFCGVPGAPCEAAKNTIDKIAEQARDAYAKVYEREADAEAEADADPEARRRHGRIGFCGAPGTPCLVGRDADPEAEARRHGRIGFCGAPGTPCLVGRDAMPHARGRIGFCGAPGTPCLVGRDAEAVAAARRHLRVGFCGAPGTPCLVGRDAEAEPEADPEAKKHHKHKHHHLRIGFCGAPGTPCLIGRDAEAIGKIIKNADPNYLKKECFKEGNECHTLLKVQQAFQKVKNEGKAAENVEDAYGKLAHCGEKNAKCGVLTQAHQYAKKHNKDAANKSELQCRGPKGLCAVAQRDLEELEESINAAVAGLNEEQ